VRAGRFVTVVLAIVGGCGSRQPGERGRLWLLPLENLSPTRSEDWVGPAIAVSVADQLATSARWSAQVALARGDALAMGNGAAVNGYFVVDGGRIRVRASVEDLRTQREIGSVALEGVFAQLPELLESFGRSLDPSARAPATQRLEALRHYAEGRFRAGPAAVESYREAVAADPGFAAAYFRWAELLLAQGDRVGAARVLDLSAAQAERFPEVDRTRLELLAATVREDFGGRIRALRQLVRLTPLDAAALRSLGAAELAAGEVAQGAARYRELARLEPTNPLVWNELGYAEAVARNPDAARRALEEYQRLAPGEANPLDSLGDVHYYLGRFGEAERFYRQAYERNPAFLAGAPLYKAARARLMSGDRRGADGIFQQYLGTRRKAGDPFTEVRQAQWEALTGKREAAEKRLMEVMPHLGSADAAAMAGAQIAAWRIAGSDPAGAHKYASEAALRAQGAPVRSWARVCLFLAGGPAPAADLEARARREFPSDERERLAALGYGLLLSRQYSQAATALRELRRRSDPFSGEPLHVLEAWALIEAGKAEQGCALLGVYGFPSPFGEHPFAFVAFPRVFLLESTCLHRQGRTEEARRRQAIYERLLSAGD
jgi:Flp pilus assembly protein TadD